MTIGKRIVFGFTTLVAVIAGVGGYSLLKFNVTQTNAKNIEAAVPSLLLAQQMQARTLENYNMVLDHILTEEPEGVAEIEARMKASSEANAKVGKDYESAIETDEERGLFATYNVARTEMIKARNEVLEASRSDNNKLAVQLLRTKLEPLLTKYRATIDDLMAYNQHDTEASAQAVSAAASSGRVGAMVAVVAGILLAIGSAVLIIRSVSKALTRIAGALNDGSSQVASASTQVSASSQSLAQGASEQAASLEESSSAIEEMASMIKKNADTSAQANALSDDAKRAADQGTEAMERMNTAIVDIERASQETAKIIKTIDEIAFQTNLLALNAAVEAARAGEAGKGFAVVAEEVRNLAMRSAEAAKNTSSLIEESVGKAKNGVSIAQTVASNLQQINDSTTKVTGLIAEIAAASKEQATGIDQISQAVGQMDKVTQTNAANAEETAAASEELNAQAEQLQACVRDLQTLVGLATTTSSTMPAARKTTATPTTFAAKPVKTTGKKSARELIPLEDAQSTSGDFSDFSKAA